MLGISWFVNFGSKWFSVYECKLSSEANLKQTHFLFCLCQSSVSEALKAHLSLWINGRNQRCSNRMNNQMPACKKSNKQIYLILLFLLFLQKWPILPDSFQSVHWSHLKRGGTAFPQFNHRYSDSWMFRLNHPEVLTMEPTRAVKYILVGITHLLFSWLFFFSFHSCLWKKSVQTTNDKIFTGSLQD